MSVPRILLIIALVLSICCPVQADDSSGPRFIEGTEQAEAENCYEGGNPSVEGGLAKYDFTDQNAPERDLWRPSLLATAVIDIRHAPIHLLVACLRR